MATVMPPWSCSTADWLFTSITPEVIVAVTAVLAVAFWLIVKTVPLVMPVMKEPSGMPAAVTCMPGASPAVVATVTFVVPLAGVIEGEATVAVVPSAEARPVFTTPPAMTRRPLHEELAALR